MAFQFESGRAANVAGWFTVFEAFMLTAGWTVEDGSGTQQITFKSIGEVGGRAKLYIRFRQDGVNGQEVWYRVQDDLAGTHFTTEGAETDHLDAGGGGAAAFDWWMAANRDYVTVCFLFGATYTGCYAGLVVPYAASVPDEEYEMAVFPLHRAIVAANGRVLRRDDDAWDQITYHAEVTDEYVRHLLDLSYCIFPRYLHNNAADRIIGELIGVSGRLNVVPGLDSRHVINSSLGAATSWWTVLGSGTVRWAMFCGGTLPTRADETGFVHTSGTATDINDLQAKLDTFLTGIGWTINANGGIYSIDQYYSSPGESSAENIWIHWRYNSLGDYWEGRTSEPTRTSHCPKGEIGDPNLSPGDFPLDYEFGGDLDCFYVMIYLDGIWRWGWFGLFVPLWSDASSYPSARNSGLVASPAPGFYYRYMVRGPSGQWVSVLKEWADMYVGSSPQALDGTTYVLWPDVINRVDDIPIGIPKYIHHVHSSAINVGDTVTVGAKVYKYIAENWCVRIT